MMGPTENDNSTVHLDASRVSVVINFPLSSTSPRDRVLSFSLLLLSPSPFLPVFLSLLLFADPLFPFILKITRLFAVSFALGSTFVLPFTFRVFVIVVIVVVVVTTTAGIAARLLPFLSRTAGTTMTPDSQRRSAKPLCGLEVASFL